MIQFNHVSKAYGDTVALDDLDLTIESGEIFGLIGHNGAGKTTTISLLTSIIQASHGTISSTDLIWKKIEMRSKNGLPMYPIHLIFFFT